MVQALAGVERARESPDQCIGGVSIESEGLIVGILVRIVPEMFMRIGFYEDWHILCLAVRTQLLQYDEARYRAPSRIEQYGIRHIGLKPTHGGFVILGENDIEARAHEGAQQARVAAIVPIDEKNEVLHGDTLPKRAPLPAAMATLRFPSGAQQSWNLQECEQASGSLNGPAQPSPRRPS